MSYVAYIVILLNILILNTILNTTKGKISYNIADSHSGTSEIGCLFCVLMHYTFY